MDTPIPAGVIPIISDEDLGPDAITAILPEKYEDGFLRCYRTTQDLGMVHWMWSPSHHISSFQSDGIAFASGKNFIDPAAAKAAISRYIRTLHGHPHAGLDS